MVELFKYRHKHLISKDKVRILSVKVPLAEDEIYTKGVFTSEWALLLIKQDTDYLPGEDNEGTISITFAYSPGGNIILFSVN